MRLRQDSNKMIRNQYLNLKSKSQIEKVTLDMKNISINIIGVKYEQTLPAHSLDLTSDFSRSVIISCSKFLAS